MPPDTAVQNGQGPAVQDGHRPVVPDGSGTVVDGRLLEAGLDALQTVRAAGRTRRSVWPSLRRCLPSPSWSRPGRSSS